MILIRAGQPEDAESFAGILTRAVHEIACRDYSPAQLTAWAPGDIAGFVERHERSPSLAAEIDGRIAGFATLGANEYVDLLYVDPDFQRRGVASALLAHIEREARTRGGTRLHARASLTARPLFERNGFTATEPLTVELRGVKFRTWLVEKRL